MENEQNKTNVTGISTKEVDANNYIDMAVYHIDSGVSEQDYIVFIGDLNGESVGALIQIDYDWLLSDNNLTRDEVKSCVLYLMTEDCDYSGKKLRYHDASTMYEYTYNRYDDLCIDLKDLNERTGQPWFGIMAVESGGAVMISARRGWGQIVIEYGDEVKRIGVSVAPYKTEYMVGEKFNPNGMIVKEYYSSGDTNTIMGYSYFPTGALTVSDKYITISYNGFSCKQNITVHEGIDAIKITKLPDKMRYLSGETFDPSGMVVKAIYTDGGEKEITDYTIVGAPLTKNNKQVTVKYTYGGITKTADLTVRVMSAEEGYYGNKYYGNACIGDNPKWNLATMGIIQNLGGISAGNNSFAVGANLIYVQQMPYKLKELCENIPYGWKIDVQQFLIADGKDESGNMTYKYIDGEGFVHTFAKLEGSNDRYYDVEGAGLILKLGTENVISNIQGDELHFDNGRLIKSVSGRNSAIIKIYEYDAIGRLVKIYDNRDGTTHLTLSYGTYLNSITATYKNKTVKTLNLNYSGDKFVSFKEKVGSNTKTLYNLKYDENGCLQTVENAENNAAVKFETEFDSFLFNEGYKTRQISTGYIIDGAFAEKSHMRGSCNVQTTDFETVNEVWFYDENNLCTSYVLNGEAKITGKFEGNRFDGYKTLETETGLILDAQASGTESAHRPSVEPGTINGKNYVKTQNGVTWLTIDDKTIRQFDGSKNLALTFYLYNFSKVNRLRVKIKVNGSDLEWVDVDPTAYESWQKVIIPFHKPDLPIQNMLVRAYSGETPIEVLLNGFRLIKSDYTALYVNSGLLKYRDIDEIDCIYYDGQKYSRRFNNNTDDCYMSESDMIKTIEWKALRGDSYLMYASACNGKKYIPYGHYINAYADTYLMYDLSRASNSLIPYSNNWYIQTESADGNTVTKKYYHFTKDGTTLKTEVTCNGKTVTVNESYNRFGQILSKTDEYGATINYAYFDNGDLQNLKICADGKEMRQFEAYNNEHGLVSVNYCGFGSESYSYNNSYGVLDNIRKYDYNVSSGNYTSTDKVTKFVYDNYYEKLTSVTAKDGEEQVGQNTLTDSGTKSTVSDGKVTYTFTQWRESDRITVGTSDGTNSYTGFSHTENGLKQTDAYFGTLQYFETTEYDKYGKVLKKGTASYTYKNSDGSAASYRLSSITDTATGVTTTYEYDDNQVKEVKQTVNDFEKFKVTQNSATETEYRYGGSDTSKVQIIYDTDKLISPHVTYTKYFANGNEVEIECWKYESYDGFGRLTQKNNKNGSYWDGQYRYEYLSNGTRVYNQLSACKYNGSYMFNNDFVVLNRSYEYDGQGNISKEYETCSCASPNSDSSLNYTRTNTYTYDSQNRLITAKDGSGSYSCNYDTTGRLKSMNYNGASRSMTYENCGRLTKSKFIGGSIDYTNGYEYDYYGNRTLKTNGYGGVKEKYNWTRGRFLSEIRDWDDNVISSYVYNADGIRYSKTVNGVTTTFYYNGTTLMGEDRTDGKKLRYCYDREGICGFRYYNGSEWKSYTYVKNPQGDIILIKDDMGTPKVKYTYDPWGNVTYRTLNLDGGEANPEEEELAKINPFRYRGYYYDEESKLYYLITRYYDPWEGLFISPDSFEYLDPETIGGVNLYAYCNYNPIMYVDPEGKLAVLSFLIGLGIAAGVGAAIGSISYVVSEGVSYLITHEWTWSWGGFLGSIIGGAIGGALSFAVPGLGIIGSAAVTGGLSTGLGMAFENAFGEANHSLWDIISNSILSSVISGVLAGLTSLIKIPGFTGRGSISQVARQTSTKFYNGTISSITLKTLGKIILYEATYSAFSTVASGIIDAYNYFMYLIAHAIPFTPIKTTPVLIPSPYYL